MKRYQSEPLSPWDYGWTPEVVITDASGAHEAKKHLSPGRFSHEIAYVLPDQRTVYLSDDGYAVGWFLFVADRPADLSAGTLYAAKLAQQAREGGGSMAIEWVSLGHSTDEQIRALVDARVPFSALFDVAEPTDEACADGFTFVRHAYGEECLRLAEPSEAVPDPALAASRLETRRYAALVGATTELVKGEGVAYDEVGEQVFVAISSVKATMSDGKGHLDLDEVPCGVVYQGPVAAGVVDSEGAPIDSDHVMTQLLPAVVGRSEGKGCAADSIANPDNITFLSGYGQLVIAEDTSKHANAFLWSYDLQRGELQRLMVAPPYGEMTGVHWIPDLNGFGYLTVSVQHPWSEGIDGPLPEGITEADTRSFTGVLGPFPSLAVEAAP
jgi:secreted PhoX family phosphatase